MADQQHGLAGFAEPLDQVQKHPDQVGMDAREWLVQQDESGIMILDAQQLDQLLLSTGQLVRHVVP